jgi:hypothetical protein
MTLYEKLKKDHSDIIQWTLYQKPNYEVICFDKYLNKIFPNLIMFISSNIITEIRYHLDNKYHSTANDLIKLHGVINAVRFDNLKYYQPTVGINELQFTKIDEPISVINYEGEDILMDGYHRTLFHLLNNRSSVEAYVLKI